MDGAGVLKLLILSLLILLVFEISATSGMNVIDKCWRTDPNWRKNRQKLAACSVGFAGKMMENTGKDVRKYTVTDPSDDPINPRPGTLRYGASIQGKVWIRFEKDMQIKLKMPLLVSSFTAIDGRGTNVEIAYGSCIFIHEVTNVIIHGISIHNCQPANSGGVVGAAGKIIDAGRSDGDGIAIRSSSKIWIDHNTLYKCQDGLIDITRGSTWITVSNNQFKNQDKVMLLGHADWFQEDKNMKVTMAFNHFGPNCYQRMPRVRSGYAHIANNYYEQWGLYAIGGSSNPSILSEGNVFKADGKKLITWNPGAWNLMSVKDSLVNGAYFPWIGRGNAGSGPGYTQEQSFIAEDSSQVGSLTQSAGALDCLRGSLC